MCYARFPWIGSKALSVPSTITIRGPKGEETLDLEEFEDRVERGGIEPNAEVWFPPLTGSEWVRVGDLDAFRGHFEPKALYFNRAFRLGRVPLLTLALTLANLFVFLAAYRRGPIDVGALIDQGAKAGPLLHDLGQSWRLLAANFVHRDWGHLGFNLFVVFHFGAAVENAYRRLDYLLILLASALGTTLVSYAMTDAISAGASGIGYGMLGSAAVFGLKYRRILPARYRSVLGSSVVPTLLVFLYIGWISSGVDNWGHVGGLLAGVATTSCFRPRLLGDPPVTRALLLTRIAPLVLVVGILLFGGPLFQAFIPRMVDVRSERFGLELDLPAHWNQRDELVFDNGMPPAGRASFTAGVRASGELPDLEAAAAAFVDKEFRSKEAEGKIRELEVGVRRYAHVDGMLGIAQDVSFVADGTRTLVTTHLFSRGSVLYSLVFARATRLPGYARVFEQILGSVRAIDPEFVLQARRRVAAAPTEVEAWLSLSDGERQVGNVSRARQALEEAQHLEPDSVAVIARLASLSFLEGLGRQGCQLAAQARQAPVQGPLILVAAAECAISEGDHAAARALLLEALESESIDPILRARARRLLEP